MTNEKDGMAKVSGGEYYSLPDPSSSAGSTGKDVAGKKREVVIPARKVANGIDITVRVKGGLRWRLGLLKLVYRITSWVTGYGIKVEIEGE